MSTDEDKIKKDFKDGLLAALSDLPRGPAKSRNWVAGWDKGPEMIELRDKLLKGYLAGKEPK